MADQEQIQQTDEQKQHVCNLIVQYLETKTEPVRTPDLAKALFGPDANSKHINSYLYSLKAKGMLKKTVNDKNCDPKWSIGSAALTPKYRDAVLAFLRDREATPTKDIKVKILGPGGKQAEINKVLYELQNEGLVIKISDDLGKNPKWQFRS